MARALTRIVLALLIAGVLSPSGLAESAGPWRGTVVDAETGRPLEGVVVLAVWDKLSPGIIHNRREFHDAEEAVTDASGNFILSARSLSSLNPFVRFEGPRLLIFKGGYGMYRFRGELEWDALSADERVMRRREKWKQFEEKGVVFELPPLKTREERRRALPREPSEVPDCRMLRLLEAINEELVYLGFTATGRPAKGCN